jgi:hypothetical protein
MTTQIDHDTAAHPAQPVQPTPPPSAEPTPLSAEPTPLSAEPTQPIESSGHLELPFAWEDGPHDPELTGRDTVFRFPAADDPRPGNRRLLGMSVYASLLGLLGLAVAVRGLLAIMGGAAPGWYEPALAGAGVVCVLLVVGAFLSIHRRVLPWLLLLVAAAPLAANIVVNARAL